MNVVGEQTAKFVPSPDVYQCHFFVAYQDSAKKKTAACIALSSRMLYVLSLKNNQPAAVKDKISPDKIAGLSAVPGNERAVKIAFESSTVVCITANTADRNAMFALATTMHTENTSKQTNKQTGRTRSGDLCGTRAR